MAVREAKHNRGEEFKCGEPSGGAGQPTCPAPFFIDLTLLFEGVPCPETSSRTASTAATAALPSSKLGHQGNWDHSLSVSTMRRSDRNLGASGCIRAGAA